MSVAFARNLPDLPSGNAHLLTDQLFRDIYTSVHLHTYTPASNAMATAPYRALTRVSIAWSGNPASEDTDTLVLTIGRYSVDLRMWASGPLRGEIEWGMVGYVAEAPSSTKGMSQTTTHLNSRETNVGMGQYHRL